MFLTVRSYCWLLQRVTSCYIVLHHALLSRLCCLLLHHVTLLRLLLAAARYIHWLLFSCCVCCFGLHCLLLLLHCVTLYNAHYHILMCKIIGHDVLFLCCLQAKGSGSNKLSSSKLKKV